MRDFLLWLLVLVVVVSVLMLWAWHSERSAWRKEHR
jgi:hypothetical protein